MIHLGQFSSNLSSLKVLLIFTQQHSITCMQRTLEMYIPLTAVSKPTIIAVIQRHAFQIKAQMNMDKLKRIKNKTDLIIFKKKKEKNFNCARHQYH